MPFSHSTAPPAACSSSSGNPKPVGLWHSTSSLPVEEDGFHQGDHIPARVVPSANNRNVQELPRDKQCLLRLDTPPPLAEGCQLLGGAVLWEETP